MREDEIPEPEDHPDLEAERAFANAVIVEGMKRNPERAREVIADVARSFAERYKSTTYDTELGGIGPAALRRPYRGRRAVI